jgi:uncharacterized damage-inducible protein DinB
MFMRAYVLMAVAGILAMPGWAQAQTDSDPLTAALAGQYAGVARNVRAAAEAVSEGVYGFRPTPDVRTLGELLGHIAEYQYILCSDAAGEPNPNARQLEEITSQAEMAGIVAEAIEYCSAVWDRATDEWLLEPSGDPGSQLRVAALAFNNSHTNEHYGNIVTYLRLNGIVPPSSMPAQ